MRLSRSAILQFAGQLDPSEVSSALAPFAGSGTFLTRWSDHIAEAERIDGDYVFAPAATDTAFEWVTYRVRNRGDITGALLLLVVSAATITATVVRRAAGDRQAR
jgi:sugar (pentulose or hexulose) kinase